MQLSSSASSSLVVAVLFKFACTHMSSDLASDKSALSHADERNARMQAGLDFSSKSLIAVSPKLCLRPYAFANMGIIVSHLLVTSSKGTL